MRKMIRRLPDLYRCFLYRRPTSRKRAAVALLRAWAPTDRRGQPPMERIARQANLLADLFLTLQTALRDRPDCRPPADHLPYTAIPPAP
jgi:hypothetical protein